MAVSQAIVRVIRERSREGELIPPQEIFQHLVDAKSLVLNREEEADSFETALSQVMERNEDLKEVLDPGGDSHYYSAQYMSEGYAGILLRKKETPVVMIAEIVRENSAVYPRPIPLDAFKETPFEMTEAEIRACLEHMVGQEGTKDICQTTTSIGTVFLFSSHHLDQDHAAMLAEWLDVGQFQNP
jgi:hypothetical protein